MLRYLALVGCLLSTGCAVMPEIVHQPTVHNPFPQLSKVAVAPFFNLSEEPTLNGREVAAAYFAELQGIQGFEVTPLGVVENAIIANNLSLDGPEAARRLAQILEVDAVVIGSITDFSPYYPPRLGLRVEWYAANPNFHPIPPGYGLPWGTPEEEGIPAPLVLEAEMALARAQLKTQTPQYQPLPDPQPPAATAPQKTEPPREPKRDMEFEPDWEGPNWGEGVEPLQYEAAAEADTLAPAYVPPESIAEAGPGELPPRVPASFPPDWPDPRGFIPLPPSAQPSSAWPTTEPVLEQTKIYRGNDMQFTEALASYYYFRDEARFGGWQAYLQRSEDFIRFCCHMNILEMLTARGGAGETRVVWRWPTIR